MLGREIHKGRVHSIGYGSGKWKSSERHTIGDAEIRLGIVAGRDDRPKRSYMPIQI